MRFRTLEIRWHDSKPISTCDFQPLSFKKARPAVGQEKNYTSQAYRLATGGEDNHVRVSAEFNPCGASVGLSTFQVDLDGPSPHSTAKYRGGSGFL